MSSKVDKLLPLVHIACTSQFRIPHSGIPSDHIGIRNSEFDMIKYEMKSELRIDPQLLFKFLHNIRTSIFIIIGY